MVATWGKILAAVPDHCLVRVLAKVNLAISQGISLFFFIVCLSQKFIFSLSIGLQVNLLDSQIDFIKKDAKLTVFLNPPDPYQKVWPGKICNKNRKFRKRNRTTRSFHFARKSVRSCETDKPNFCLRTWFSMGAQSTTKTVLAQNQRHAPNRTKDGGNRRWTNLHHFA